MAANGYKGYERTNRKWTSVKNMEKFKASYQVYSCYSGHKPSELTQIIKVIVCNKYLHEYVESFLWEKVLKRQKRPAYINSINSGALRPPLLVGLPIQLSSKQLMRCRIVSSLFCLFEIVLFIVFKENALHNLFAITMGSFRKSNI